MNGHLGLSDSAIAVDIDRHAVQRMQHFDAALPGCLAGLDKLVSGAEEPGCLHGAALMPDRAQALPVSGIAPHGPVFEQPADAKLVVIQILHWSTLFPMGDLSRRTCSLRVCVSHGEPVKRRTDRAERARLPVVAAGFRAAVSTLPKRNTRPDDARCRGRRSAFQKPHDSAW